LGQIVTVTSLDTPGVAWDSNNPTTKNPWSTTAGANAFREFVVAFSTSYPKNYMALASADWTITFAGKNAGGDWVDTSSAVTLNGTAVASSAFKVDGFPKTGDAAGVQVLGLSFVNEFGMVVSPAPRAPASTPVFTLSYNPPLLKDTAGSSGDFTGPFALVGTGKANDGPLATGATSALSADAAHSWGLGLLSVLSNRAPDVSYEANELLAPNHLEVLFSALGRRHVVDLFHR
jgi:hypothetical protein